MSCHTKMGLGESVEADSLPSFYDCFSDIYDSFRKYAGECKANNNTNYFSPVGFFNDMVRYGDANVKDLTLVLAFAVGLTLLRQGLTSFVFLPLVKSLKLTPESQSKFPESGWKALYYGSMWANLVYLLIISGKYDYFYKPFTIWDDWKPGMAIPTDLYYVYIIQFSFYLHSVYSTIYLDRWRRDSIVMIFHHFLTMGLIGFSFAVRYHKIGIIVLFLHDIADICLECTKCCVYLKDIGGIFYTLCDALSAVGFSAFGGTWFWFRLYWFPLIVLYSTGRSVTTLKDKPTVPFYVFFNGMLWILLVLNVYWFMFILNFIYRVATGTMQEVGDIREFEVVEKNDASKSSPKVLNSYRENDNVPNGLKKSKRSRAKKD